MKRIAIATTMVAGVALILAIVLTKQRIKREESIPNAGEQISASVAMKWQFAGTMAPYFAAQRNGVFSRHGLKIRLVESGPSRPSSIQQVVSGRTQFGITGAHDLAVARLRDDQSIVAIAVIFKMSPTCLMTTTDKRITEPVQLVGKKVEMTHKDNSEFEYLAMLRKQGVNPLSVEQRPFTYVYSQLIAGTTDAVVAYENDQPITLEDEFKDAGKTIYLIKPRDYGITPYADVLFTTEELIRTNPDLVASVVDAFLESWEVANTNAEETIQHFLQDSSISKLSLNPDEQLGVLRKSLEFVKGGSDAPMRGRHIPEIGVQEPARWEETVSLLTTFDTTIKRTVDPFSLFTNKWAKQHAMVAPDSLTH